MTPGNNCLFCNSENLWQPIQMHFSKKQKKFSQLFAKFLKSI